MRWMLRLSSTTCTAAQRRTERNDEVAVPAKQRRHKGLRHYNN